ncbi:MAG TPA: hypothetical protein PLI18_14270 [Pirellulaceae bacterium]|nr:hypothetical protein [Pirellulaceae bacterium]
MKSLRCLAFDCFGTVFDTASLTRDDVRAYVEHVRRDDFSPFAFSDAWRSLPAHPDAAAGIARLRAAGFVCVTLSNGSAELLAELSRRAGIEWDRIIDLAAHRAYKPRNLDAYRAVERETGFEPAGTLMVTANPTFGDVEGAASIGMPSQIVRHGRPHDLIELAEFLEARE